MALISIAQTHSWQLNGAPTRAAWERVDSPTSTPAGMFQPSGQPQPALQEHDAPTSPSSARHLISAPPHAPALHHLADVPLALPGLAAYGDQARAHLQHTAGSLTGTISSLTPPLYGVSEYLLPTNAMLTSALPAEDHPFGGLLPSVSSPSPLSEPGSGQDPAGSQLPLSGSYVGAAGASLPSWAHLSNGAVFMGLPSVSAGAAASAAALSGPVVQLPLAIRSSSSVHPFGEAAASPELPEGFHTPVARGAVPGQPQGTPGQNHGQELPTHSRLLEASSGASRLGGAADRTASEAQLRGPKRQKAWSGTSHTEREQQQRQHHDGSIRDASPHRSRPPLRGANVEARAPPDADSGTDTDGDDDLLERVREILNLRI